MLLNDENRNEKVNLMNIKDMRFSSVYPLYLNKIERKGRTKSELDSIIYWLTNYDENQLNMYIQSEKTFQDFFDNATLNDNAHLITGMICGIKIETIRDPLIKKVRYLDKLVDELSKGRKLEKILRK